MQIELRGLGKKYAREWIFSRMDWEFHTGKPCAITGANGSGKSTLLQIISGSLPSTKGNITYTLKEKVVDSDQWFRHLSYAAPYLDLIEEFTLAESIRFHFRFKAQRHDLTVKAMAERMQLGRALDKKVEAFSSGMKQRLRLGLAFYSDTPLLILDEPTSNLDQTGIDWYLEEVQQLLDQCCVLIGSNQKEEYSFCTEELHLNDWKKKSKLSR